MLSKSETGQFTEWARAQQPWLQLPALLPSSSATLPPSLNCSVLQCCSCRTGINMRSLQPTTSSQLVLTCNLHITRSNRLFPSFYINCLENPMDRGAQQATVLWGCKSRTWLSDWASKDIKSVLFSDSLWLFVYSSNRKLTVSPNKGQLTTLPQRSCLAVVESLSHVWLFVSPWTAALQASPSSTISRSLLKFMSDPARHSGISHNHGQQNSKETETEGEAEDQGQGGEGVSSW